MMWILLNLILQDVVQEAYRVYTEGSLMKNGGLTARYNVNRRVEQLIHYGQFLNLLSQSWHQN